MGAGAAGGIYCLNCPAPPPGKCPRKDGWFVPFPYPPAMRIAYFAECMLPGQDGVSRVLNQTATHLRGQGHAICWIMAVPD